MDLLLSLKTRLLIDSIYAPRFSSRDVAVHRSNRSRRPGRLQCFCPPAAVSGSLWSTPTQPSTPFLVFAGLVALRFSFCHPGDDGGIAISATFFCFRTDLESGYRFKVAFECTNSPPLLFARLPSRFSGVLAVSTIKWLFDSILFFLRSQTTRGMEGGSLWVAPLLLFGRLGPLVAFFLGPSVSFIEPLR